MMKTDPHHWSRAWFKLDSNCDSVDNNMCESFNNWIISARFLPIISMLEVIRCKVMVRIQEQRTKAQRWQGQVCPNIFKKLKSYITESCFCHALWNGKDGYEVKHHDKRFTVSLENKTCSCRYWQLSGLPCCHAVSCIYYSSRDINEFIAKCYSIEEFNKTYEHCLQPVEGITSWPTSERPKPRAPAYVKMPGRPRKERRREPNEKPKSTRVSRVGTIIRCRLCKGIGHNRGSCMKRRGEAATNAPMPPLDAMVMCIVTFLCLHNMDAILC